MNRKKLIPLAIVLGALTTGGIVSCANTADTQSLQNTEQVNRRVKPGQVVIQYNIREDSLAHHSTRILTQGSDTFIAGLGWEQIAFPVKNEVHIFTSDTEQGSPNDDSISIRINGSPAKVNFRVRLRTIIDPSKKLSDLANQPVLNFMSLHPGVQVGDYLKSDAFKNLLTEASNRARNEMNTKTGAPYDANGNSTTEDTRLTQERIVQDGEYVALFYNLVEKHLDQVLIEEFGGSPVLDENGKAVEGKFNPLFDVNVSFGQGEGGDKIELDPKIEEVYLEKARAVAEIETTKSKIDAQKEANRLALEQAKGETVLLRAHKDAGTLDAYVELKTTESLAGSGNLIIASPDQRLDLRNVKPAPAPQPAQ